MSAEVRTSASHPLQIGWVQAPVGWRIGITIAPGKCTTSRAGFRWARVLDEDLELLTREGIGTLVCLLEAHEIMRLGIGDLVPAAEQRGLHVIQAPIPDISVPSTDQAHALITRLLARRDDAIVIHCNGGLGRSGLVAGCLLRALGVSAAEALRRLVTARGPECPQTSEQRRFVEDFSHRNI